MSLLTSQAEITPHNPTLSLDGHLEQLVRIKDVDSTRDESKVVAAARNGELADEDAFGVPSIGKRCQLRSKVTHPQNGNSSWGTYTLMPSPPPHAE